ncbi:unnamed protein product [Cuscuta campestris]|uniref:Uncharacterized protein n=1 Tax=Cuscuta campestris TaxID=132261 RepID=A0A484L548_9ASTE|nr:unnamed protein product [Cuscuta campestris]
MRGDTLSFGSSSRGGSSAVPTKSGLSSTPPPSLRDSWDSLFESASVHRDPSAELPGSTDSSEDDDEKTPSPPAPPTRRGVVPAVPAVRGRGGRGRQFLAPPSPVSSAGSVASHHPSQSSSEDSGSPSQAESTGHSAISQA